MAWNTLSCKTLCKMMSASGRERKSKRKTEDGHRHTWKYDRGRDRVEIKALARVHVCPMCVFVFKLAWCRHNSRDLQKTLNTDHHWYDHKWHTPIPKQPNQTTAYHTKPNGNGMKLEKERKKWKKKRKTFIKQTHRQQLNHIVFKIRWQKWTLHTVRNGVMSALSCFFSLLLSVCVHME